jgi:putative MATE family efflux protein
MATEEAAPAFSSGGRGQRDLTAGAIAPTLLAFALPTLGSNVLQSLNGSINTVWVGRFLGEEALAATSNANIIMFLMFGMVFGFGMAATILVGQSWGRHDHDGARRAFGSAVGLVLIGSALTAALGYLFARDILTLLATPGGAYDEALAYLRVIFLGLPPSMLLVLIFMGLRGIGDSLTPLWFMGLSVVLDSALNPVFILGLGPAPALGIAGSATATLIANIVSCGALLLYIRWRDLPLRLKGAEIGYIVPQPALVRVILSKGLPIGAQMLVISTAGLTMVGLVNRHGVDVTAAYGITQQLWTYVQMPAMAIGAAVSAMAAQNIGARRWDRVSAITRSGILFNLLITGAVIAVAWMFDRALLSLFAASDSRVIPIAQHINAVVSWAFMLFGVTMVVFGTVRANGAVWGPLAILFVSMFPVRLGAVALLRPILGLDALWWAFPISLLTSMSLSLLYYWRGTWRKGELTIADPRGCEERSHADVEPVGVVKPA